MPLPGSCSTRPHAAAVGLAAVPLLKTRAFCRRPTKGGRVSNGGARNYRVLARGAMMVRYGRSFLSGVSIKRASSRLFGRCRGKLGLMRARWYRVASVEQACRGQARRHTAARGQRQRRHPHRLTLTKTILN